MSEDEEKTCCHLKPQKCNEEMLKSLGGKAPKKSHVVTSHLPNVILWVFGGYLTIDSSVSVDPKEVSAVGMEDLHKNTLMPLHML